VTIGTNLSITYGVLSTEFVEKPLTRSLSSMISSRPAFADGMLFSTVSFLSSAPAPMPNTTVRSASSRPTRSLEISA
jgi:hypothetical protein